MTKQIEMTEELKQKFAEKFGEDYAENFKGALLDAQSEFKNVHVEFVD